MAPTRLQASLDTCNADLTTAKDQLKTCQATMGDYTANLGICQGNVGACSSALTTCQTDVEGCHTDLTSATGDLSNCQGSLSTAQSDLAAAQAAVAALTASDADLVSAITAQGVSFANATGYGATATYTFAADGSYVEARANLACAQSGTISPGAGSNAPGTWTVSGNVVTVTDTASQTTATLMAVKASDGTVSLVDFGAKQLYVHN